MPDRTEGHHPLISFCRCDLFGRESSPSQKSFTTSTATCPSLLWYFATTVSTMLCNTLRYWKFITRGLGGSTSNLNQCKLTSPDLYNETDMLQLSVCCCQWSVVRTLTRSQLPSVDSGVLNSYTNILHLINRYAILISVVFKFWWSRNYSATHFTCNSALSQCTMVYAIIVDCFCAVSGVAYRYNSLWRDSALLWGGISTAILILD